MAERGDPKGEALAGSGSPCLVELFSLPGVGQKHGLWEMLRERLSMAAMERCWSRDKEDGGEQASPQTGRKKIQMGNSLQSKEGIGSLANADVGAGCQLPFC